ncbi:hypothetical protein AV654_19425 [Paenibacillus elgii]|uniref:YgiT-type zinc finger protein n=1 Tax=Paenibacillus elgii TaxID=189691 RepID=A0A163XMW4_9BACL|nr:hypothetical protein [Paenibacillus elgii]KZE78148.1 hypothetical protein AV654_19425 [Paenibacillus elgii]
MKCKACHGSLSLDRINFDITITEEIWERKKVVGTQEVACVVEDVLVERCDSCGEIQFTSAGLEHIERERTFFENQGLYIRITELSKLSYSEIAERWGDNKQRQDIYQYVKDLNKGGRANGRMFLLTAFKFAQILNYPFTDLFEFRPIIVQDGKYYLTKEKQR